MLKTKSDSHSARRKSTHTPGGWKLLRANENHLSCAEMTTHDPSTTIHHPSCPCFQHLTAFSKTTNSPIASSGSYLSVSKLQLVTWLPYFPDSEEHSRNSGNFQTTRGRGTWRQTLAVQRLAQTGFCFV